MQVILTPHAGFDYASKARASAFNVIKEREAKTGVKIKKIIYLATVHQYLNKPGIFATIKPFNLTSSISPPNKTKIKFPPWIITDEKKFPRAIRKEHSYKWIVPELVEYFPNAWHYTIYPYFIRQTSPDIDLDYDIDFYSSTHKREEKDYKQNQHNISAMKLASWLVNNPEINKSDTLVIATTDLIHYDSSGENYNNNFTLPFPQQIAKMKLEEPLIASLINSDIDVLNQVLQDLPFVSDSPYVLSTLVYLTTMMKLKGRVVDYYDSSSISDPLTYSIVEGKKIPMQDEIDKYTISWRNLDQFVSYISIVFYDGDDDGDDENSGDNEMPNRFDIMQAIGAVRTVVAFDTILDAELGANQIFPIWSFWNRPETSEMGVFVGSSVES